MKDFKAHIMTRLNTSIYNHKLRLIYQNRMSGQVYTDILGYT